MTGAELIAAERERQMTRLNWTPEHDDEHVHGELARAAATYLLEHSTDDSFWVEQLWPWDLASHKFNGSSPVSNLVRAGALVAAEIDRLHRKQLR